MKNNENVKIKGRFIRVPAGLEKTKYVWFDKNNVQFIVDSEDYTNMCRVILHTVELNYIKLSAEELVDIIMLMEV